MLEIERKFYFLPRQRNLTERRDNTPKETILSCQDHRIKLIVLFVVILQLIFIEPNWFILNILNMNLAAIGIICFQFCHITYGQFMRYSFNLQTFEELKLTSHELQVINFSQVFFLNISIIERLNKKYTLFN